MSTAATVEIAPDAPNRHLFGQNPRDIFWEIGNGDAARYRPEPDLARPRVSGFARMADAAARLTRHRSDILCQLLRATCETVDTGDSPLKPIWVFENATRARVQIRLLSSLDRLRRNGSPYMLSVDTERDAADRLSAGLSLLKDLGSACPVSCSALLRHVVSDLVELFGPTVGEVSVATQIEPLMMTNVKRRALVLVACDLLLHSISDGYHEGSRGTLLVSLKRIERRCLRLTIADDGCGKDREPAPEMFEAVEDMTAILHGDFTFRHDDCGGMIAELTFPCDEL
jgi:hypothetical protein